MTESATNLIYGQSITLQATVSNTSGTGSIPTGVVQFWNESASPPTLVGQLALTSGVATTTLVIGAGSYNIASANNGLADSVNANYNGSTSPTSPTVTVTPATTATTMTQSATSLIYGQTITLQATVSNTSGSGSVPAGVVQFFDESASPPTLVGDAILSSGVATITQAVLGAGSNNIAAVYNGTGAYVNTNYTGSTSPTSPTVSVTTATTTTTMTESATSLIYGQTITLQATVSNTSGTGAIPTGVVQFWNESASPPSALGQATVTIGVATTTLVLGAGSYNIAAAYNGQAGNVNANYIGSTSPTSPTVTVIQAMTATTMTESATSLIYGQTITLLATVSNRSGTGSIPTGMVQFWNESASPPTLVGQAALASGVATTTPLVLGAGIYNIAAVYSGPAGNSSGTQSTSPTAPTVTVTRAATSTTMTESATSLIYGQSITLQATVSNASGTGSIPAGVVQFFNESASPPTLVGQAMLASGVATTTPLVLAAGSYNIAAAYNGLVANVNANNVGSISPTSSVVTVTSASTSTTLTEPITSLIYGESITLQATVSNSSDTGIFPTGAVPF